MAVGGILQEPWDPYFSGIHCSVDWQLLTDVSELHIGPIFKGLAVKEDSWEHLGTRSTYFRFNVSDIAVRWRFVMIQCQSKWVYTILFVLHLMCSKQMNVVMKLAFTLSTLTRIFCHWTNLNDEIKLENPVVRRMFWVRIHVSVCHIHRPVFTHWPPGPGPRAANFQGRHIKKIEIEVWYAEKKRLSTREKFKGDLYWKQCWYRVFSLRRYWRWKELRLLLNWT